jgi:hypothetical protein
MSTENTTPIALIVKLVVYFTLFIGLISAVVAVSPDSLGYLPFGGADVFERGQHSDDSDLEITQSRLSVVTGRSADGGGDPASPETVRRIIIFLAVNLLATVFVMLPVTWTYVATKFDSGPSKSFVRALIVLPICASTVVLLIQDSLALAFGLAALVAAVRFRVALSEAIDGIYIFAAICVGLGAGIGYLGVATIMAMFFCITNAVLWMVDYGNNPIDDMREDAKRAKINKKAAG